MACCVAQIPSIAWALLASVVAGLPVTYGTTAFLYRRLNRKYPEDLKGPHRDAWMGTVIGLVERGLVTTLTFWLPQSLGPLVGSWMVIKAAGAWTPDGIPGHLARRVRYFAAILGSLISVFWAIGWGLWATARGY